MTMATAEMERRRFLVLAAGGAGTLSGVAAVGAAEPSARDDPWKAAFEEARTRQPWLAGYDSAPLAGYGPPPCHCQRGGRLSSPGRFIVTAWHCTLSAALATTTGLTAMAWCNAFTSPTAI